MNKSTAFATFVLLSFTACSAVSQDAASDTEEELLVIGTLDFYGLQTISEADVRELLPFSEGSLGDSGRDLLPEGLEEEIASGLDVPRVELIGVCCMDNGQAIVFIGVEEILATQLAYHTPPEDRIRLPSEILRTEREADEAMGVAFRNGDRREDHSEGHSFAHDPEARAIQERFVGLAEEHWDTLIQVLHTSSRPQDRATAARVIAYAGDKAAVAPHLEHAILDSDVDVKNNATRALAIIAT